MLRSSQIQTDDGISWHVEQSGSGPHILLIPSGEGDCHSFTTLATLLSPTFTVTTFDMPGFSRSLAPASSFRNLTIFVIADQIISLMDKLSISSATMYGSSSGGLIAIASLLKYNERVERIIIHEIPLNVRPELKSWCQLPESENAKIVANCKHIFANVMNENKSAWENLGSEFHARLEVNYVTWLKNYVRMVEEAELDKEDLKKKRQKVSWTVGALTPVGMCVKNVVLATELGIRLVLLNCKHFPQVSIPGELAEYIRGCYS
jgi:pimeloyl-ACP methyl ester carboxylesterase